jgi:AbiU2
VTGHHSADQVRAAKLAAMPASLGELHYALWNEVAWLHLKWKNFRALFGTSAKRVELLKQTAPAFFHHLQGVLWEDVLLHISRLTDPPESMGHANLTLRRLPSLITDPQLRARSESLVNFALEMSRFARDWRNRRLAHKELPPLDGGHPQPLVPTSRQHVEETLAAIREAMNLIELHYQKSTVAYEHSVEPPSGVEALLFYLEKGLEAQRLQDEALLAQEPSKRLGGGV